MDNKKSEIMIQHFKKKEAIHTNQYDIILVGLIYLIRFVIIWSMIRLVRFFDWFHLSIAITALVLTFLPYFIEKVFRLQLPVEFEFINSFFIFTTLFLGSIGKYYVSIWWWDFVLHFLSGVVLGLVSFVLIYVLYCERRIIFQPVVIPLVVFLFAVTMGTMWEIYEFSIDQIFGITMQDRSLHDTMTDLIADSLGAFVSATIGYFYMKESNFRINKFIRKLIWNTKRR